MRTTGPISTISFNTKEFLKSVLDELVKNGVLSFYAFIVHKPEDDEAGSDFHIHLYMEPSKIVQTDDFKKLFAEFDPEHPNLPRTCIKVLSSKFGDWCLYSLHNKAYLKAKHQSRQFTYGYSEIITSDERSLKFLFESINIIDLLPYEDMRQYIENGLTWKDYFNTGCVPITNVRNFQAAWQAVEQSVMEERANKNNPSGLDRNGREGHKNKNTMEDFKK